ncbi:MAG: FG-GAP-like repeat-containing protein [Acidobacteriota bacterium]
MTTRARFLRSSSAMLALCLLMVSGALAQTDGVSDNAAAQISALLRDKDARTPAQRKIDSNLLYATRLSHNLPAAPGVSGIETGIDVGTDRLVVVDIAARVTDALLTRLEALGATVINGQIGMRNVRVEVSLDSLEAIAAHPDVVFVNHRQGSSVQTHAAAASPAILRAVSPSLWKSLGPGFATRAAALRARVQAALAAQAARTPSAVTATNVSEGRTTHRAAQVTSALGYTGAGITVGVISDGVNTLSLVQASGDLGTVTVLPGQQGSGDEGTAMLEIVHDLAPGARLFFATANPTIAQFAQNILDLRAAGCDIIVDDISYFAESPFQRGQAATVTSTSNGGLVVEAVATVTAAGAMYFSSAGNEGNVDDGTAGTYEGDFVDGGAIGAPVTGAGNYHQFAAAQNYDILNASGFLVNMSWSDPLGASANDYDVFVLNSTGTAVSTSSTNVQTGTQDPYEECPANPGAGSRIVIVKRTGAAPRYLRISTFRGRLSVSTPGDTFGHNATPVPFGYTVAATPAAGPFSALGSPTGPYPGPFNSTNTSEVFESDGPRRIFFNADSTAITPGNFGSTGGLLLQKPDFTAADGVSCTASGFSTFFGTSAAAPHAAAIAALLKSMGSSVTRSQIETAMTSTSIDIEAPGTDRDTGVGILDAFAAANAISPTPSAALLLGTLSFPEASGNANGSVEPGECGNLTIQLVNGNATVGATAVSATLTTSTPGVTIIPGTSAYPDIAANGSANNTAAFQISVANTVACPTIADFTLTITFSGAASPTVLYFSIRIGTPPVSVSTTLDGTAPAASALYVAATGSQTGRLNRFTPESTCAAPKTNPGLLTASGARAFDSYTFTNCASGPVCVRVNLKETSGGANALFSAAYSGSYNPAAPATNYLADQGSSFPVGAASTYSFNVAAGQTFVVVVHEVNTGGGAGATYELTVDGMCLPCATYAGTGCSVSCPTITLSPASLPNAIAGTAYNQVVTPSGGVGPYAFNTTTGLPPGITATPSTTSVTLAGTATVAFSGTVTVSGTDANACPFSMGYPFSVVCPAAPALAITATATVRPLSTGNAASIPDAGVGATYTWVVTGGTLTSANNASSITFSAPATGFVTLQATVTGGSAGCGTSGTKIVPVLTGDFSLDGRADLLWRNTTSGLDSIWTMNSFAFASISGLPSVGDTNYELVGSGDFDGDGKPDLVWRHKTLGFNSIWLMNGLTPASVVSLPSVPDTNWHIQAVGDLDGDGKPDLIWRNVANGVNGVWIMNGTSFVSVAGIPAVLDTNWNVVGTGDFDFDGKNDLVWRNKSNGLNGLWMMNGTSFGAVLALPAVTAVEWKIAAVGDYDQDGKPDLVWRNTTVGFDAFWKMNGTSVTSVIPFTDVFDTTWSIAGPR